MDLFRVCLWFVWFGSGASVAQIASDFADKETILIQLRLGRSTTRVTQQHQVTFDYPHQQHDAMSLLSLEDLERLVSRISVKAPTEEEISLVGDFYDMLENTFLVGLANQSQADSTEHAAAIAAHGLCIADSDNRLGVNGDVTQLKDDSDKTRVKHQACRKATKSYSVFRADMESVLAGDWGTLAPSSGNTQVSALASLSVSKDTFLTDVATYRGLESNGQVSESCDVDQTAFELTWCSWFSAQVSTCTTLDHCVGQVNAEGSRSRILTRDANRRATYHSIKILQCRLQHIASAFADPSGVSNSNSTDECSDVAAPPADYYNLNLEYPASVDFCSSDDDVTDVEMPSSIDPSACARWRNKEYNADGQQVPATWDIALHSHVDACLGTCVVPTAVNPVGPGAGDAQCISSSPLKAGRYDVPGFCFLSSENKVECKGDARSYYDGEVKWFDWTYARQPLQACAVDTSDVAHLYSATPHPETVADVHMCLSGRSSVVVVFNNGTTQHWDRSPTTEDNVGLPEKLGDSLNKIKDIQRNSAGGCALLHNGTMKCWGATRGGDFYEFGGIAVKKMAMSYYCVCVIQLDDTFQCKSAHGDITYTPPDLKVKDVSVAGTGSRGWNICAIRLSDDQVQCWSSISQPISSNPPADFGTAKFVLSNQVPDSGPGENLDGACAVLTNDELKCWGGNPPWVGSGVTMVASPTNLC